jgi:23S rRNA pseudouridine1911/1915/1917 synthase
MIEVLYEDNHLLAVNKPALLATMGVAEDKPSLLTLAKEYIRQEYHKPGNVYLGIVSRLDAPVTGVVLLARTSKAASRLTEQFRDHRVEKIYWALVEGGVDASAAELHDFLCKDERHRRMHVTGRKHQIRVQLSHASLPIVGDRKYGSSTSFPRGIALHARRLVVEHPVRKEPLTIEAPLPESWSRYLDRTG